MKTAISVPDPIFRDGERHARRAGMSRSQLYSNALAEYLARHGADHVTEAMNAAADAIDTRPDPFVVQATRQALKRVEW